jgi:Reverse transcriptase (RNA-dependent DNA polymerase)/gag-polyprotein putative aspartyl protease
MPSTESRSFQVGINSAVALELARNMLKIPVYFENPNRQELALIDSGAGGNFMHEKLAKALKLPRRELKRPIAVRNVDGTLNIDGQITHRTIVPMTIGEKQHNISFLIGNIGDQQIILGLPWLIKEDPNISWKQGTLEWPTENLTFEKVIAHFLETEEDEESLAIYRAKLSETFNQIYGTKDERIKPLEEAIPRKYHKYLSVFDKKTSERLPSPRSYDHEINLKPDFKPKKIPPYSLNPEETKLARKFIDENMAKGYIRPSKSPMASPLFFVGKKEGTDKRPCQDYRWVNEGTIKDSFPIPKITDLLRVLQKARIFTKLDIRWGYNNILIKEEDRYKAAFSTPFGLYEPTVMFFGLCNSPATFQRMMNEIFQDELFE